MAYLGRPLATDKTTRTKKIDSLAASFNSACTVFNLTSSGEAVYPATSKNLLISINGVIQEPDVAFTVNAATITFTSAPSTGATFFGVLNGEPNDLLLSPYVTTLTIAANGGTVFVGNTTANAVTTSAQFAVANSTNTATLTPISLTIGTQIANTTGLYAGANVYANTTTVFVGNSTSNTVLTSGVVSTGNVSIVGVTSLQEIIEKATISATAATGTIAFDALTQGVLYYTTNASANWTVNFRGNSTVSLNTVMTTGQSLTVAFLVTQGATAYYASAHQVDGNAVTPKWQNGTAPTSGNINSVDIYAYTIVKTGSAAFTVFASQTKFA